MAHRDLENLVRLSQRLGSNPDYVLVGGGNTSVKTDGKLLIKASGKPLQGITAADFVALHRDQVRAVLSKEDVSSDAFAREAQVKEMLLEARVDQSSSLRASVETSLHELLPFKYVIHTHAIAANGLTCARNGKQTAKRLFGDRVLWVDYTDPGYTLAKKLKRAAERYRAAYGKCAQVILLQSHGIFVGANSSREAERLHREHVARVEKEMRRRLPRQAFGGQKHKPFEDKDELIEAIAPAIRRILGSSGPTGIVHYAGSDLIVEFVCSKHGHDLALQGALIPDDVAYCNPKPVWIEYKAVAASKSGLVAQLERKVLQYRRNHSYDPRVLLVEGVGLFAAGESLASAKQASEMYQGSVKTSRYAEALGGARPLSKRAQQFIETWEVEKYRREVVRPEKTGVRHESKIAVVTGAAQGLGREIAGGLARAGMYMVAVDVDEAGAKRTAGSVQAECGPDRAIAVGADVTHADQVERAVHRAVETYGGIDVLISNAGILMAHKVTDFPEAEWRRILDVNLVGYFLCARAAARVMQYQKSGDIIQINSKSGKKGSKHNSAYAASKFGGIGLTQSLALDLAEDGIRVNAVCPGNLFDSPLWSDNGGLFDQYKAKLGVRTRNEVRKHYEAQIPLGRGCLASDVLKTILYILDQGYETGQAYNVTGGQETR